MRERRVIERWLRSRWIAAAIGVAAFVCSLPIALRLEMDRDISGMFDPEDPALIDYLDLQATFGGNAVAMIVYRDVELMSVEGIARNDALTQRVMTVSGVRDALSPSRISKLVTRIHSPSLLSALSSDPPALLNKDDPVARGLDDVFAGYTHSSDGRFAAVVAILQQDHSPATIESLREIGEQFQSDHSESVSEVALVGEPVLIHDGFALIERDGAKLATWTIVLLSIVVLVSMFDLRFVLLMSVVVVWSVTITRAALVVLSIDLSLVSTILTAIVTVIAVAAVLHLGVRFRTARRRGKTRLQATANALSRLTVPIFWTCATDAAGFAALTWSRIMPVGQFGQMIAIAAMAVFVAIVLFAPAALMLPGFAVGKRLSDWQRSVARRLQRFCRLIAVRFLDSSGKTMLAAAIVAVIAVAGLLRSETETSFLKNFRDRSELVAAYENVEQDFGGAGVWDIVVEAPADIDDEFMECVRDLQDELREIDVDGEGLTKVLSIADIDSVASRSTLLKFAPVGVRLAGMRVALPVFSDALLSPVDPSQPGASRKLRIMLRSREHLTADKKTRLIEAVNAIVAQHTGRPQGRSIEKSQVRGGRVTGYYVIMTDLVAQLVRDQWRCFAASGAMVWILLIMATRSVRLATAALVPNLLPVLTVLAVVGIFGGKINMGAAMIAAVSIGLSIDGSVHFLASYRIHRRRGHDVQTSVVHAAGSIGVPVVLATIALVIGFSVLATSEFVPTATFGVLVAATMAAGTIVNLSLLPVLVRWFDR